MNTTKFKLLAFIAFFGIASMVTAQKSYKLDKTSTFTVSGTSTLHDWDMTSPSGTGKTTTATGTATLTIADSKLTAIEALSINLPVENIKSHKEKMDKVAYEHLDTKKHPNIKYVLKSAHKVNETTWELTGTYTIVGANKVFKTTVKTTVTKDGLNLQGSEKIKFSDFGMERPKALLGTVKAGDELTLKFNVNFN